MSWKLEGAWFASPCSVHPVEVPLSVPQILSTRLAKTAAAVIAAAIVAVPAASTAQAGVFDAPERIFAPAAGYPIRRSGLAW